MLERHLASKLRSRHIERPDSCGEEDMGTHGQTQMTESRTSIKAGQVRTFRFRAELSILFPKNAPRALRARARTHTHTHTQDLHMPTLRLKAARGVCGAPT